MKCLVVLALATLCLAEPPASSDSSSKSVDKDKRGVVSGYDGYNAGHAIALPASSLGYGGYGHSPLLGLGASPLLLSGSLGHGYPGYAASAVPAYSLGHGLGHAGLGHASLGHATLGHAGLGHGLALGGYGGHGLALAGAQPLLLSGGYGHLGKIGYGSGLETLSLGIPTQSLKVGPVLFNQGSADHSYATDAYTSSYSAPTKTASYSSGFQPSYSSSSSYSGSNSYSAPSSSYGAPSSSYGAPSSSYGAPSSSYGAPSSYSGSYSSDSYSTVPYTGSKHHH